MSNWEAILRVDGNRELLPAEQLRYDRIKQNHQRMVDMGLLKQVTIMESMKAVKSTRQPSKPSTGVTKRRGSKPMRASARLMGATPEYAELEDPEEAAGGLAWTPLEDLLDDDAPVVEMSQEARQELQERRCGSQGRGSMYDSALGITCHFCRQKKLCGERDCPRCNDRDSEKACVGKTECQRCHSATGRFCRACLQIRYGEEMEDARTKMTRGEWLCAHCYEEEHPGEGWVCNSSICMKRAGRAPTGIAIFEAQRRGHASVAHWLQAQYKLKYCGDGGCGEPAATTTTEAAPPAATTTNRGHRYKQAASVPAVEGPAGGSSSSQVEGRRRSSRLGK